MSKTDYYLLRWAGGKRWLLKYLNEFIPSVYNNYHEPFLGGASIFLYLNPPNISFLSDTNEELINTYLQIRDNLDKVWNILKTFKNTREEYYRIRDDKKYTTTVYIKAARFLYLNRTSFNGIYRVNLNGTYNVPYGNKNYKYLFEYDKLRKLSERLQGTILNCCDYKESLKYIEEGDLVYLDPPYTVSHSKNGFIKYNEVLFSRKQQYHLVNYIDNIVQRKAFFILSQAKHPTVKHLFSNLGKRFTLTRPSVVGGKYAKRGLVQEYIFSNSYQGNSSD